MSANRIAVLTCAVTLLVAPGYSRAADMEKLVTGATFEVESGVALYPTRYHPTDKRVIDDTFAEGYARVSAKSQANVNESVVLGYDVYGIYSTIHGQYKQGFSWPSETNIYPSYYDFNTLFLRWEGKNVEVTMGKDKLEVGLAELYSPANRFGRSDYSNPLHIRSLGVWQLGAKAFIGSDTLAFHFTPFEQHGYLPQGASRWVGESSDSSFYRLLLASNAVIEERWQPSKTQRFGYLLHYKGVAQGLDYFAALHHGPSNYAVLRERQRTLFRPPIYWKEFPIANTATLGLAKTIGSWKLFDEALYQDTMHGKDQDFVKNVVGFSYKDTDVAEVLGLEEIEPVFSFATDGATRDVYRRDYVRDSEGGRRFESSLLGRIRFRQNDNWTYFVDGAYTFTDEDNSVGVGLEYKPDDNTTLTASARKFDGVKDSQLGRYRLNNYFEFTITRKF